MIRLNNQKIPQVCGVYFFRNKNGRTLYIGKAVNIRNRIKSYFTNKSTNPRIAKLLELATKITWQETGSEIEALILESQLIKKYRPAFNIMLRDDKQYFYVVFTKEKFPRVYITHPAKIFASQKLRLASNPPKPTVYGLLFSTAVGPFTDGSALKTTLRLLRRIFPYCTCKQNHNIFCLNYHIGKCLGFCCLKTKDKKQLAITRAVLVNYKDGPCNSCNFNTVRFSITKKAYQKNIKAIKNILNGKRNSLIKKLEKEMTNKANKEDFEQAAQIRDQIEKIKNVFENARIINELTDRKKALVDFQKALSLPYLPQRIEGYDISNMQGLFATGSMVVFTDGRMDKNGYRKFKIQTVRTLSDVGMLKEMLERRFNHREWPMPDLVLVDGGKPQLAIVSAVLESRKLDIPVVALTKNELHKGDHIYATTLKAAMPLKKLSSPVRNLILQIDSEAHHFAISYYRKLHRNPY